MQIAGHFDSSSALCLVRRLSSRALIVGKGAYLKRGARILEESGFETWLHRTDGPSAADRHNERLLSSGDPNEVAANWPNWVLESLVVLANNPFILHDVTLRSIPNTYNLHISDVRRNRGLGHLCLVHTLLTGDLTTGITVQRLAPGHPVDGGPTLTIRNITLSLDDGFPGVMARLPTVWELALRENVLGDFEDRSPMMDVDSFGPEVSFDLLDRMVFGEGAFNKALAREGLGNFARYFPRTSEALIRHRKFWIREGLVLEEGNGG